MHHVVRQSELRADGANLILEQVAQRLDQFETQIRRQATHVVVGLDPVGIVGVVTGALDHVGIERSLRQVVDTGKHGRLAFEDIDEGGADSPALLLRIHDPPERIEERIAGVDCPEVDAEMTLHDIFNAPPLVATQQPVVDDQARQLAGDRALHEGGADCRVDTSGKGAEHVPAANLVSDGARRLLDEGCRLPATAATGHLVEEVAQDLAALGRVNDLGMEGDAKPPGLVRHRRDGRVLGFRQAAKPRGRFQDGVAVTHPDRQLRREIIEEPGPLLDPHTGRSVFAFTGRGDLAAELVGEQLHAIADAQHRDAGIERRRVAAWGGLLVDAGRSSREDERLRRPVADRLPRRGPRDQFAVDAGLANPACDQLAVLRSEIEDQHQVLRGYGALLGQLVPYPACGGG